LQLFEWKVFLAFYLQHKEKELFSTARLLLEPITSANGF
jgi:hypothetical protein